MSITDRAVDPKHYIRFNAARRFLIAAGFTVKRSNANHSMYFFCIGNTEYIGNMWSVIEMAEQRGMK